MPYTVPYDILHSAFEKNWMYELIYLLSIDQGKLKTLQSTQHTLLILPVTENGDKEPMVLFLKQDISIMTTDTCLADGVIPCCTTIIACLFLHTTTVHVSIEKNSEIHVHNYNIFIVLLTSLLHHNYKCIKVKVLSSVCVCLLSEILLTQLKNEAFTSSININFSKTI